MEGLDYLGSIVSKATEIAKSALEELSKDKPATVSEEIAAEHGLLTTAGGTANYVFCIRVENAIDSGSATRQSILTAIGRGLNVSRVSHWKGAPANFHGWLSERLAAYKKENPDADKFPMGEKTSRGPIFASPIETAAWNAAFSGDNTTKIGIAAAKLEAKIDGKKPAKKAPTTFADRLARLTTAAKAVQNNSTAEERKVALKAVTDILV